MEKLPTLKELLTLGEERLRTFSPSPKLDAEILLAFACAIPKYKLLTERSSVVSPDQLSLYQALLSRREGREPVAYLNGKKEFYGRDFEVTPAVLIPRPESELLVERALEIVQTLPPKQKENEITILDLGTGSGCLIISVIEELRAVGVKVRGVAIDLSEEALKVAKSNAQAIGCLDLISFLQGDWFSPRNEAEFLKAAPFDLILANPPYVAIGEEVSPETSFEPQSALYSGELGLQDTRILLEEAGQYLKDTGIMLIEIGAGKRAVLPSFLKQHETLLATWCPPTLLGDNSTADRFTVVECKRLISGR